MKQIISKSWQRCRSLGLRPDMQAPAFREPEETIRTKCQAGSTAISVFHFCLSQIKAYLNGSFLFLLTDRDGTLLAMDSSHDLRSMIASSPIRVGTSFKEEYCGTNAISIAMSLGRAVYMEPEQHYCGFLKNWHCFSTPLAAGSEVIGYLDISTIKSTMKKEWIAIATIFPEHFIHHYQLCRESDAAAKSQELTERQLIILKLIARGHTEKSIAVELQITESTVKHHKKAIFEKWGVHSSSEAVLKGSQLYPFL